MTRDTDNARWPPPSTLLASQYDRIAKPIMEQARERPWGVLDRRYKLHDASFGTFLLQTAAVLDRLTRTATSLQTTTLLRQLELKMTK